MTGLATALSILKVCAKQVPAYQKILRRKKIRVKNITTYREFKKLPILDKKNYLRLHKFPDLFAGAKFPPVAHSSSGSSGEPTFWFRSDEQEKTAGLLHERIFRETFQIKKTDPTLVVICFSMGIWVAGNFTQQAMRYLSKTGYNLTLITPGIEKPDILHVLRNLAPQFKNLVLAGYPPFIMDVVAEARNRKISINKNIKFLTAGDKFSEEWREVLFQTAEVKDYFRSLVSIYGSADLGLMGFETPLTIAIRKLAADRPVLYRVLFGQAPSIPALVQYDPTKIFVEMVNGELVFTVKTGIPLVRYNIHDLGRTIEFADMMQTLREMKAYNQVKKFASAEFRLPFIIKTSRTDVAVTFYALNIYPENIESALKDRGIAKYLSGNFSAYTTLERGHEKLNLKLELAKDLAFFPKSTERLIKNVILEYLIKQNMEFRKLHSTLGQGAEPKIIFAKFGSAIQPKTKGIINIRGKKPKVIMPK